MSAAFVPAVTPVGAFTSAKTPFTSRSGLTAPVALPARPRVAPLTVPTMGGKIRETRDRITSVKNTQKITTAMRLVAAAKVRRAQDAVLATRPFSSTLQKVLGGLLKRLEREFVDVPLLKEREVKTVVLVCISGDRGLCGSYNTYAIKRMEQRKRELEEQGIKVEFVVIGNKMNQYMRRRSYPIRKFFPCGQAPTAKDATAISEELLAEYLSGEVDRVELCYSRFVSLIASQTAVRTLLPLSPTGIETEGDEIFQLTSREGSFDVKTEKLKPESPEEFRSDMIFEQDPEQMLGALLPLYLNGQMLRCLQESVASELAARMTAMSAASDNAKALAKSLTLVYNRARQAGITQDLCEIVGGAAAAE